MGRQLSRLKIDQLKEKFKDDRAEVRAAAARVAATRNHHLESELIELLNDDEKVVWQAAHEALVTLGKGVDFGPKAGAGPTDRKAATEKWRAWLDRQNGR